MKTALINNRAVSLIGLLDNRAVNLIDLEHSTHNQRFPLITYFIFLSFIVDIYWFDHCRHICVCFPFSGWDVV